MDLLGDETTERHHIFTLQYSNDIVRTRDYIDSLDEAIELP